MAFVWCGVTVLIPVFDSQKGIEVTIIFLAIQRFLIVTVLILPFDIRDVKYDSLSLQTIPKKIGVRKTKRLGLGLIIISLIIEYFLEQHNQSKSSFLLFLFLVIIFLMRSKKEQTKYYSSFWVEALPIFWWLTLLGFRNF